MVLSASEPLVNSSPVVAHAGVLTGHWEFDLAILSIFLGVVAYSFLLPQDAPRGVARLGVYTIMLMFLTGAFVLAVMGFRSVVEGK